MTFWPQHGIPSENPGYHKDSNKLVISSPDIVEYVGPGVERLGWSCSIQSDELSTAASTYFPSVFINN
ncbi:hypothetical protein Pcinc_039390 [Petrolisthes cinctipes]|uniref:Uncharacterized protein n=1 Tax=Petrolisthes cinctipes TaxID=88211 RepID=A0AAE1BNQ7_PETCI|nr:hypothetical protein Pcinc_039390 [Petrolisthes cinctipes]